MTRIPASLLALLPIAAIADVRPFIELELGVKWDYGTSTLLRTECEFAYAKFYQYGGAFDHPSSCGGRNPLACLRTGWEFNGAAVRVMRGVRLAIYGHCSHLRDGHGNDRRETMVNFSSISKKWGGF